MIFFKSWTCAVAYACIVHVYPSTLQYGKNNNSIFSLIMKTKEISSYTCAQWDSTELWILSFPPFTWEKMQFYLNSLRYVNIIFALV